MDELSKDELPKELGDILSSFIADFDVDNNAILCSEDSWEKLVEKGVLDEYNLQNLQDNKAFREFILKVCRINSNLTVARLWSGLSLAVQIR